MVIWRDKKFSIEIVLPGSLILMCEQTFKALLHYGKNCSKLVVFYEQKYFAFLNLQAWSNFCCSVNTT